MITKEQLLEIGRIKKLNKGQTEKDYLIDLILYITSSNTKDELVFKGGTCLNKAYNMDRFSEDIDFTQIKETDHSRLSEKIIHDLKYFNIESTATQKRAYGTVTTKFSIRGPLYMGEDKTKTTIKVDVNTKSTVIIKPESMRINSLYPEVPSTHILVMHKKEILAEKIRALLTRAKARDLYDINYLLGIDTPVDRTLLEKKLEYYKETLDSQKIEKAIHNMQNQWGKEMRILTRNPSEYSVVAEFVLQKLKEELP
jgi:predicted nucleotidyltransferase component of viral defense system